MIFVGLYFLVVALVGAFCVAVWRRKRESLPASKIEYIEYTTPDHIADIWTNYNRIGECKRCGGDDAPLMVNAFVCKWCAEKTCLTDHIVAETRRIGRPLVGPKKSYGEVFLNDVIGPDFVPGPAMPTGPPAPRRQVRKIP